MRRTIALATLIVAGCASSASDASKPRISIDVGEPRSQARIEVAGPRSYIVRVTNRSDGPITVDSIRIDTGYGGGFEVLDGSQRFDDLVGGGASSDFNMMVNFQQTRDRSAQASYRLDSLRVEVSYHSEAGSSYFESCTCSITRFNE